MDFTYGIVTFNSETTIIETLESIKFQITKYGSKYKNYLVISDDCSKDNTLYVIDKWLKLNSHLFTNVKKISTGINSGLCVNYALMVDNIKTDHFIQLAGDDLICSEDIYSKIFNISNNELKVFLKISFNNNGVIENIHDYILQSFYSHINHTNKKDIWILELLSPYSSVEISFNRQLYTDECMSYIKNYRNFEDDTSLFYILKHNKKALFNFDKSPLVLYRRGETSLTKITNSSSQIAFLDDLYVFRKHTLKCEKNIFVKLFLFLIVWDNFLMKHRFAAENCLDRKIKRRINNRIKNKVLHNREYQFNQEEYVKLIKQESKYLNEIKEAANEFMNTIVNSDE